MKIKVSKTFQKVLAIALCMIMVFGAAPLAGVIGLIPDASAEELYTIRFFGAYEDEPFTDLKFAAGETLFTVDEEGKTTFHDKVPFAVKEGYTFIEWQGLPKEMPAENIEVTALWEINEYTITFEDTGDVAYEAITQDYATAIADVEDPVKTGYTFAGWDVDGDGVHDEDEEIPTTMPAIDNEDRTMVITAKWTVNTYTFTFDADGGKFADGNSICIVNEDYGTALETETEKKIPADPTREGYNFLGWAKTKGETEASKAVILPKEMPAENNTYYAIWGIDEYTITLNANGGEFANGDSTYVIKQNYDTAVTAPENPTKDGYTFVGWLDADGKEAASIPERMPAENKTLKADWNANSVDVTYDPNGGYVVDKDGNITENAVVYTYTYDSEFKKLADPTRTGYTFLGWFDESGNAMPATIKPGAPVEYKAKWSEGTGGNFYKVSIYTMDENGGYSAEPAEALYAAEIGEVATATCDIATGFKLDPNYHTDNTLPSGTVEEKHTAGAPLLLEVHLARETYVITLNANGGSIATDNGSVATVEISGLYATAVTAPANPTREGYAFDGWKNNATGKIEVVPSIMPAANTSYTAQWVANTDTEYKIVIKYIDVTGEEKTDENGYATEVVYNGKGTTGATVKILIDGTAADDGKIYHKLSDFALEHYKFDSSDMSKHLLESKIAADGSTVLKLYFIPVKYNVSFAVAGDVIEEYNDVDYYTDANDLAEDLTDAVMEEVFASKNMQGYTFTGWTPDLGNITGDTKYEAVYVPNQYTITFKYVKLTTDEDGNEAEIEFKLEEDEKVKPIQQYYNKEVTIPAYPAKAGYKCLGWHDDDGNKYGANLPISMPAGDFTLTAKYEALPYTITFDPSLKGATLKTTSVTEACDEYVEITADMKPEKQGYTFKGWYDASVAEESRVYYEVGDKIRVPANDLTLVAEWSVGKFMVVFKTKTNDGEWEILNDITYKDVESDAPITAPNYTFSKEQIANRTFLGWREEGKKAGDPLFVFDKMPGRSVVLEAVWGATVTFDANSGVLSSAKTVVEEINLPINITELGVNEGGEKEPTKTGYTFTGWYETKNENGSLANKVRDDDVFYYEDTTIYAGWTINEYKMTFDANGGKFADGEKTYVIEEDYNTNLTELFPKNPTRVGYTFAGWDTAVPATMPAKSMTIKAKWTINQYTFTFLDYVDYRDNGKETVISAPIKQDYNTEVIAPANPVKTGYTWRYWVNENGDIVSILDTMPAFDVTYYGVWRINHCEITFNTDGGTPIASIDGDYGTEIEKPAAPTKTGYTFAGWKDQHGNMVEIPDTIPAEDLELTAQWTVNQYTITFRDSDGTVIKSTVQDYGTAIVAPANPVRTGSVFNGWDIGSVPATVPAHDLIFTAVWQDTIYTITFVDTDGDVIDVVSGKYGSKVRDVEEPSKWFYHFAGWDKEVPATMPAENMVITATWEKDTSFTDFFSSFFMSFFSFLTQIVNYFNDFLA